MHKSDKKTDNTELTHSSIHHLLAINHLLKTQGYARGIDIAKDLNITRGSVSVTLNKIKQKGFISEDQNKFYQLTKKGKQIVNTVLSKRRITETFIRDVLKLPVEVAEADGCKIEHLISQQTSQKLFSFIGYFLSDDDTAINFRKGYERFQFQCDSYDDCAICETICFFAKKEE